MRNKYSQCQLVVGASRTLVGAIAAPFLPLRQLGGCHHILAGLTLIMG